MIGGKLTVMEGEIMSERYTEYEFKQDIKHWFVEELEADFKDLADDEREHWGAESVAEGMTDSGRFHEIVDGCVPIYNYQIVTLWLDCNMPEAEDYGDVFEGDIIKQMMAGLYWWADEYARENFEDWHSEVVSGKEQG